MRIDFKALTCGTKQTKSLCVMLIANLLPLSTYILFQISSTFEYDIHFTQLEIFHSCINKIFLVNFIGSHTIGDSRCTSFRQRLYNQTGNGKADFTLDQSYAAKLRTQCPRSGGDQNLFVLDFVTPVKFDNNYFKNLLAFKGLLSSDEILLTDNKESADLVKKYAERNDLFFEQFAKSMVKMGNITPLTGSRGEIRRICRRINN